MIKVNLILLAAGFSRRFGSNKLMHEVGGKPMYEHVLQKLIEIKEESKAYRVVVVTRYPEMKERISSLPVICVMNPNSDIGISSSLKLGIQTVQAYAIAEHDKTEQNFMFCVADQPFLKKSTLQDFLHNYEKSHKGIGCLGFQENLGNPCIFNEKYINELMSLQGENGGKQVIIEHMEDVFLQNVLKKEELYDIDKPTQNDIGKGNI